MDEEELRTVYLTAKEEFTTEDLIKIWPGKELPHKVAEAFLQTLKRLGPGQIFLPSFSQSEEICLLWVVKGKIVLGKMKGEPLDFSPVIEVNVDSFVPLHKDLKLEIRGGEHGAILLVLPESLVLRIMPNENFIKKVFLNFQKILLGVIKIEGNETEDEGRLRKIRTLASEIFKIAGGKIKKK